MRRRNSLAIGGASMYIVGSIVVIAEVSSFKVCNVLRNHKTNFLGNMYCDTNILIFFIHNVCQSLGVFMCACVCVYVCVCVCACWSVCVRVRGC